MNIRIPTNKKIVILVGASSISKPFLYMENNSFILPFHTVNYNREDVFLVALDGGVLTCEKQGLRADLVVGDFDSLKEEDRPLLKHYKDNCISLPAEKDDTDTLYAVRLLLQSEDFHDREMIILGGTGGRLSHTMANIQTLIYLKERGITARLMDERTEIFVIKNEEVVLEKQPGKESADAIQTNCFGEVEETGDYVSVFALNQEDTGVSIRGLKYEITDATLTNTFPIGVSNELRRGNLQETSFPDKQAVSAEQMADSGHHEATDGIATISVKQGMLLIIREKKTE